MHAEILLHRGQGAARAGRPREAEAAFDKALALRPDCVPAILCKAAGLSALGDHAQALDWADRAVALVPGRAAYHLIQGRLAYDAGRDVAAARALDAACRLSPTNRLAAAYRLLVRIRQSLPRPEAVDLDALDRLLPDTHCDFQARWLVLCEAGLETLAPCRRSLALQMIAAAYLDLQTGEPSSLHLRWWRGLRHFAARASALSAARREAWALRQEAERRLQAGDLGGALDRLERARACWDKDEALSDQYLDLCLYQGRYGPILDGLGSAADIQGLERLATGQRAAQMGRQLDAQAHRLTILALVRFHQGRWQNAISLFEAVASTDPRDYIAPYFLGAAHLAEHRPQAAREWFAKATAVVNPNISRLRLQEWRRCLYPLGS